MTVYVVALGVFIFVWVVVYIFLNIVARRTGLNKAFRRGRFELLEYGFLFLASVFVILLVCLNMIVLRDMVNGIGGNNISSINITGHQEHLGVGFDSYINGLVKTVDHELSLFVKNSYVLNITSADVLHSFSMPSADLKVDAVPGRIKSVCLNCDSVGLFVGYCTEFFGSGHSYMPIVLSVVWISGVNFWVFLKVVLVFCVSIIIVAYVESPIWCCFDETMTGSWYKTFVLGEFLLLMIPIVYINDDLGEDAISDPYEAFEEKFFHSLIVDKVGVLVKSWVIEYNKCPACVVYSYDMEQNISTKVEPHTFKVCVESSCVLFIFIVKIYYYVCVNVLVVLI
ncbi:unnamed protein product [Protopolystoma xenopodis]|uniref:cytochrome-c oxidase n=1 Tax=Protopolystoma xenopodis TaxID=117903 RepID=A0A3S5B5Y9_9PLAT|nr:unnamed protein product [Protopolystoma xenopodis]